MRRSIVLTTALLSYQMAAADEPVAPASPSKASADNPGLVPPDPYYLVPRLGVHIGFGVGLGVGGEYLPGSAAVARADLNWGYLRFDSRASLIGYYIAESGKPAMGVGLMAQQNIHFRSRFMMSTGWLIAVHHASLSGGSSYGTVATGKLFSPATVRLGSKRNIELGLQIILLQEYDPISKINSSSLIAHTSLSFLLL